MKQEHADNPDQDTPTNQQFWYCKAYGNERAYGGNDGYDDELASRYSYHQFVKWSRQIKEGDFLILCDRTAVLGLGQVQKIYRTRGKILRRRCPECGQTDLHERSTMVPKWRCRNDHVFSDPKEELIECWQYRATYGGHYVSLQGRVSLSAVQKVRHNSATIDSIVPLHSKDSSSLLSSFLGELQEISNASGKYLTPDEGAEDQGQDEGYEPTLEDFRRAVQRQIKARRGQQQFRRALLSKYEHRCVISGCELVDVLEAAHISPSRGDKDQHPENGLLLRADLHTLFDLDLLGIDPETLEIKLHPSVRIRDYTNLEGTTLRCPHGRPSKVALEVRWKAFQSRL